MNQNNQNNTVFREIGTIAAFLVLFGLMVIFVPPVQADTPTVTITDYTVTPSVMMPDSLGTITVTIKNTASTASISEKTGPLSSDTGPGPRRSPISTSISRTSISRGMAFRS